MAKQTNYIFIKVLPEQYDNGAFPKILLPGYVYCCDEYCVSVHLCPCGCVDKVYIPCKEKNEPGSFWGLNGNTFEPSIQKTSGCRSHYWIKNGQVIWA
jgi:hypothetical protein